MLDSSIGGVIMKKVEKRRVSDQVYQQLKNKIITGSWQPGSKIPSENQLRQILGVSRVSIREAIHRLKALGILETHHGEGTFVKTSLAESYFNELIPFFLIDKPDIIKILEYRKIIEVGAVAIAIKNIQIEDIKKLEKIIKKMNEYKNEISEFARLDMEFHMVLARTAQNPIINKVNYIVNDILNETMVKIVKKLGVADGLYYHNKILEAVKNKNVEKSQQLMEEHIENTIIKISNSGR